MQIALAEALGTTALVLIAVADGQLISEPTRVNPRLSAGVVESRRTAGETEPAAAPTVAGDVVLPAASQRSAASAPAKVL